MLVSFLIASASAGLTITNRCGIDGAVPHSFMVTLKSPLHSSNRRSTSTSASEDKLSFLHAWVQQYNPVGGGSGGGEGDTGSLGATSNGTRRKLEANSNSTHVLHLFTETQLAVAVSTNDDVRHAQHAEWVWCIDMGAPGPPRRIYMLTRRPTCTHIRPSRAWPRTRPSR